jgi:ABC-type branched-subunit amino acid transport system substrate-binding protein
MYAYLFLLFFYLGCSSSGPSKEDFKQPVLRPEVQKVIDGSRDLISKNQLKPALSKLTLLKDDELTPVEKAVKYNLRGVIFFNESNWEKSLANFDIAKKYIPSDSALKSQIHLNIGSVYYKQSAFPELKNALDQVVPEALNDNEVKKFAQLKLVWANKYEKHPVIVESSMILLKDTKTFSEIKESSLHENFMNSYQAMSEGEKVRVLDRFKKLSPLPTIYLAEIESDRRYFHGDKSGARDLVNWLDDEFSSHPFVVEYVKEFKQRLDFSGRMSLSGVGVVLPLSGDKSQFGQRTLFGMEVALKEAQATQSLELYAKDNMGSPTVGAQAVREVIFEKKVPIVIGGLFPDLAKTEYLEARKYGVFFISLSPVQLPRDQKSHLLLEVTGSIESQIHTLTTTEHLTKFGKRVGLIYPEGELGKSIIDEFWRKVDDGTIQITAVASYPKPSKEYLDPVQRFLGLKFTRERKEENAIWQSVYSGEKSSIRRIQVLPPSVDFDWAFLATLPHESQSLIPTFAYYDAKDMTIFGGPTWGSSKDLLRDQKMWGKPVYFVGEDPLDIPQQFFKSFFEIHGKQPGVVEAIAYDGMKAALQLVSNQSSTDREDFDQSLRSRGTIIGLNKSWTLLEGLWVKNLDILVITKGEIKKLSAMLE